MYFQEDYIDGSQGYLITHFHNQVKQFRRKKAYPLRYKERAKKEQEASQNDQDLQEDNEPKCGGVQNDEISIAELNWLKGNSQNWDIYESKWRRAAKVRCEDYSKLEFPDILKKWPMLGNVNFAKELVVVLSLSQLKFYH